MSKESPVITDHVEDELTDTVENKDLTKLTYAQLRQRCKAHGLKANGKKTELIDKLKMLPNSSSKKRTLKDTDQDNNNDNDNDNNNKSSDAPPTKKRKLNKNDDSNKNKKESKEDSESDSDGEDKDNDVAHKTTTTTKDGLLKIVCYNLNGVRAAAKKGLDDYIQEENADIYCFSEMKAKLSQNPCKFAGYQVIWYECTDKAGYAGTAIITKIKPLNVTKGIGSYDGQGRAITLEFDNFYLINTYVPNSGQNLKFKDRRLGWDKKMQLHLAELQKKKPIIWTGDLNVAILDFDVYDGETNKKRCKSPGFTPYERSNFRALLSDLNVVDSYRHLYPNERTNHFTFFTARAYGKNMKKQNSGWRLDYFVMSKSLIDSIDDIQIRKEMGCSDHVPLVLTMENPK